MLKQFSSACLTLLIMGASTGVVGAAVASHATGIKVIQQNDVCKGAVVDQNGEPVIGASVVVKGTTNGTITGLDGDFSLNNVNKGDVILISFIGYTSEETIWNGAPITVILKEDTQTLDEVVIVGFGSQYRR